MKLVPLGDRVVLKQSAKEETMLHQKIKETIQID